MPFAFCGKDLFAVSVNDSNFSIIVPPTAMPNKAPPPVLPPSPFLPMPKQYPPPPPPRKDD